MTLETWVQSIGVYPIATLIVALCGVIIVQARHIVRQQDLRIEDQKAAFKEVKDLAVATNTALSSASQAMTANGAGMSSAREAMQVATAVMERACR